MFCRVVDGIPQSDLINIPLNDHRYPISGWQGLELRDRMTLTYDQQTDTVSATYTDPLIEDVKRQKEAEFYAAAAAAINQLTVLYGTGEVGLFQRKEDQAIAYQKSGEPGDAPWLAEEARRRGKPIEVTVQTVLRKAAELTNATQSIIARRGRLCDAIAAADTIDEVEAIRWE